jgi:hypothetical protein
MAWQFTGFYRDYHSRYRLASAFAYDSTAFSEAAKLIVANPPGEDGVVYLPLNFHDVGAKWRFYTLKLRRTDLWQRTRYFADTSELGTAAPGSIALLPPSGPNVLAGWSTVSAATSLGRESTAVLVRKQ